MVIKTLLLLIALAGSLCGVESRAGELRSLYRGARAMAMGDAFVAVADDEEAIFINPAGLAGNKGTSLHYLVSDTTISTDTIGSISSSASAFSNFSFNTLNTFQGKNIFIEEQISPSLLMRNFGVSFIADSQFALSEQNLALPNINVGYMTTDGIQVAYGTTVGKGFFRKKGELRLGIAAKMLYRRGGYRDLTRAQLFSVSKSTLSEIGGNWGKAYGVDLGSQYIHKINKRLTMMSGLVYNDIGDVNFGSSPDPIKGNLSYGLAAQYDISQIKIITSMDYKHILDDTDWRKKMHFGTEVNLPFLSIYGGFNQVFLTYGAAFDIWILRVTALSYGEELGSYVYQNSERRYQLRFDLKFEL